MTAPADLERILEALLFTAGEPLRERDLAARLPPGSNVKAALAAVQARYAERGINLVGAGGTWAFSTAPDLAEYLAEHRVVERKLSRAALETMAIIAYQQPVTRAEIEEIRGVQLSKGTLDVLLELGWIQPKGRRQTPGRPMTWGSTAAFLRHFSLESLADLPGVDDLRAAGLLERQAKPPPIAPAAGDVQPAEEEPIEPLEADE